MLFKYGIEVNGMLYGWHNKILYRLPQINNKYSLGLKKLNPILIGSQYGYRINKKKLSIPQLQALTVAIKPIIINSQIEDCPF